MASWRVESDLIDLGKVPVIEDGVGGSKMWHTAQGSRLKVKKGKDHWPCALRRMPYALTFYLAP
jgi:hypothetical protein